MAQGLISKKYLIDIAEAIRVKSGSSDTYTPSEMATAIANISGGSGTITKSTNTDVGLITDTLMDGICDALRLKLGTQDTYTPSEIADAILTISGGGGDIVPWSTGTDAEIVAMLQAAHNGDIDLQTDGGWVVGDTRTITIGAFSCTDPNGNTVNIPSQDIDLVITSFSAYKNNGAVLQFDFKDCLDTAMALVESTASDYNKREVGRFTSYAVYTSLIPALILAMPSYMQELLINSNWTGRYWATSTSGWSPWSATSKLGFRSMKEILGSNVRVWNGEVMSDDDDHGDGNVSQLPYYATPANRIKRLGNTQNSAVTAWWLDTWYRYYNYGTNVKYRAVVSNSGGVTYMSDQSKVSGISLFGCL